MNHYLWKARPYYRQVAGLLFLGMASGIICNITVVLPAMLLGQAIDAVTALDQAQGAARQPALAALMRTAAGYVGATALYFVTRIGKRWWLRTATRRTIANVQSDALRGVLAWPMTWLHQQPVGDTMARIISDAQVFGSAFSESTTELLDTWLFSVSLIVAMVTYDPLLTLLAMLPVPAALFLSYYARNWVKGRTSAVRLATADLTATLQESLSGVRVLRLFGRTERATDQVEQLSRRLEAANLSEARLQLGLQPVYSILITAGVFVVVWMGGRNVLSGALSTGALIAFLQLYLRFVLRGHRLPLFFNRLQSGSVAWDRLERLLAPPLPVVGEPPLASYRISHVSGLFAPVPEPPQPAQRALSARLEDVSFRYPGGAALALDDVSLDVPAGALVAVTGPVGAGKSALLRVLMGLYPPDEGQVLVDGEPVANIPADERAVRLGYLPQDPGLFSGTVLENIGLDRHDGAETEDLLQRVIATASLGPDLAQFPNGLETQIGETGIQVSGGQRQRIALARALAASHRGAPGLLLLDDPFSSVDVDTEGRIIGALREAFGPDAPPEQRTTIVLCSHRLAAFQHADLVVVLEQGRITARGTHAALLAQGGLYARIYAAQHSVEGYGAEGGAR